MRSSFTARVERALFHRARSTSRQKGRLTAPYLPIPASFPYFALRPLPQPNDIILVA